MSSQTGVAVAAAIAEEINKHRSVSSPRHFSLSHNLESDMNAIVGELWRDMARPGPLWSTIRLVHEGRDLHPSSFMAGELTDGLVAHSYLRPSAAANFLSKGATFIYNHLHEASHCIQRIHEILEYELPAKVWIQAYLTTANESAFGRHKDDHNFVVLQLLGSKNWVLYENEDAPGQLRRLAAGDGAFLRAGSWHAVSGVGEISLHLTIAFDWLTPTSEQPGSALEDPELATHRRAYRVGTILPLALGSTMLTPSLNIRSASRVRPIMVVDEDSVIVTCAAGRFRFDGRLRAALEKICDGRETTVAELNEVGGASQEDIESFVVFGVRKGILMCG